MLRFVFEVTYIALWALVLMLVTAVFFVYRHLGRMLLSSKEGRMSQGPELYKPLPSMDIRDVAGLPIHLGAERTRPLFVFVGSTQCAPCRDALGALGEFADRNREMLESVLVCAGNPSEIAALAESLPDAIRVVPDARSHLTAQLRVSSTPFAFITDGEGIVQGKGMPVTPDAFAWFVEQLATPAEQSDIPTTIPLASIRANM